MKNKKLKNYHPKNDTKATPHSFPQILNYFGKFDTKPTHHTNQAPTYNFCCILALPLSYWC